MLDFSGALRARPCGEKRHWLNHRFCSYLCVVHLLNLTLAVLATLSCALLVWQWLAARRFPLHRNIAAENFAPAVSILKPLKGCDDTTAASLASWFKQNYAGPDAKSFSASPTPVIPSAKSSASSSPKIRMSDAQLVVCENLAGANAKVAKLAQLEKLAAHDLILISDADVRVPPDFLANFVGPAAR